jgi:predicted nucleic acid-binding protein
LRLVLDANVVIAWIAKDEASAYADAAVAAAESDRAIVPALWHWEIANMLVVLERKGRLGSAASVFSDIVAKLPIDVAPIDGVASRGASEIALAIKYGLSAYDAAYLALAVSSGTLLATLDEKLASAAASEKRWFTANAS